MWTIVFVSSNHNENVKSIQVFCTIQLDIPSQIVIGLALVQAEVDDIPKFPTSVNKTKGTFSIFQWSWVICECDDSALTLQKVATLWTI